MTKGKLNLRWQVITPNMYNMNLWETSGHVANYKENMFTFDVRVHGKLKNPLNLFHQHV